MNILRAILGTVFLTLCTSSAGLAKEWRGIIPLHSTRADVERLLGRASQEAVVDYDLPGEKVSIHYQDFACDHTPPKGWPAPPPGWNVPKDTVVGVRVALKKPVPLASLEVNLDSFKKEQGDSDVPQFISYNNEEDGFSIEVFSSLDGKKQDVMAFIYLPPAKDEHLRCPHSETPSSRPSL